MKPSQIVIELANMASSGRYEVTPPEALRMNELFKSVATLINHMEAAEKEQEEKTVEETPDAE